MLSRKLYELSRFGLPESSDRAHNAVRNARRYSLSRRNRYELDISKLSQEEKNQVKAQIKNYKQIDELVLNGDLYRLSNPFTGNYFCEMLVSKDKTKAYVVGERFRGDPCDHDRALKLDGLADEKIYTVRELNLTASGKALKAAGLLYPRLPDCGSWVWHLEEVKK